MKQKKFSNAAAVTLLITAVLLLASCGEATEGNPSAHQLSPEEMERVVSETRENLDRVAAAGADVSMLTEALTGSALEETAKKIEEDLTLGRIKKREYGNIEIFFNQFNSPIAQVSVEYDDLGYYVDANTGASLTQPTGEHVRLALAAIEEDGRWKISLILAASTPETPRELPEDIIMPNNPPE
ncbi:MAG: hypothetical protein IBX61_02860 [Thermoleophilia bacterium]|nr:hypothetical protein [Thermoleophilia bacterium]